METIIGIILTALIAPFIINLVWKYTESLINKKVENEKKFKLFMQLKLSMPNLIAEMKADIINFPLNREFVILEKDWTFNGKSIVYYHDDHPNLQSQLIILENLNLLIDITYNNVKRYRMSEEFVGLLLKYQI